MTRILRSLAMGLVWLGATTAYGQGLLVVIDPAQAVRLPRPIAPPAPMPPASGYSIRQLDVRIKMVDQVAQVQVAQTFRNTGSTTLEVAFVFPLPYDGAIDRLTLMVDGKEIPGRVLPAAEARKHYEEIIRKNHDPALLEWIGTGMFQTSVFPVPPGAERQVSLHYSQVCRADHGLTDFLFPLSTAKYTSLPVEKVQIEVALESSVDIKNVYSPTHAISVKRPDDRHATISYSSEKQIPRDDFRLLYDVDAGKIGTSLLTYRPDAKEDGYFLLLASPKISAPDAKRQAKTVIFVVDRSGSMSGEKIEQAKAAAKFVLNNLREGDLFNIIAYESAVESFRPELQGFNDETRRAAQGFIDGIYAGGSTNIDEALKVAMSQLTDDHRPSYVLFLTDGLPTVGEKSEVVLANHAKEANHVRARLFPFGVGYDVNSRLLDKLARGNYGQSEYVRPSEDIEAHVSKLYSRIESPVMTDVDLKFAFDSSSDPSLINRRYPKENYDLFEGEQLVVVGRYRQPGAAKLTITGRIGEQNPTFEFPAQFAEQSSDATYAFVEKLWATRRVGEIIDELDLHGQNEELIKELVELSTKHGILTQYTSFLADEATDVNSVAQNAAETTERLSGLWGHASGRGGFAQRAAKNSLQYGGGGYGGAPAQTAPPADVRLGVRGAVTDTYYLDENDQAVAVSTVRNVASKTFYKRDAAWVDSTATTDQQAKAVRVEQFSREYFDLAERNGRELSQYLVFDEPVIVNFNGRCYRIEPPKN